MSLTPLRIKVLELARQGLTAHEINALVNCSMATIYGVFREARQTGQLTPSAAKRGRPATGDSIYLTIDNRVRRMLRADAELRGIPINQLCSNLLRRIGKDQLVSAVMDDGFETPNPPNQRNNP